MVRVKLNQDNFGFSSIFEKITGVHVKDSFKSDQVIYFVVSKKDVGRAVGKGGSNIKRLEKEFKSKIRIIGFLENPVEFIKNIIAPLQVESIEETETDILIKDSRRKTKSLLIGREGKQLQLINRAFKRFFQKDIKVI